MAIAAGSQAAGSVLPDSYNSASDTIFAECISPQLFPTRATKVPNWSKQAEEQLRNLARSGASISEIAQQMGLPRGMIRSRIAKLNITIARPMRPLQRRKIILARNKPHNSQ
jgi:hypothetical protein